MEPEYGPQHQRGMSVEEHSAEAIAASNFSGTPKIARSDVPLIAIAGIVAVFFIWVVQMTSSLWIDELGTFWMIDGDLSSTASRAWRFQGQTPLYYVLVWGTTQLLGTSEVVLRLPSLLSMLAAAVVLYRFCGRLLGRSAAIVALAVFLVYPGVGVHASDARPYALALLATLAATTLLESWLRTTDPKRAAWYGLAAAAVVYVHYVFASVFAAHALFFAWVLARSTPTQHRRLWVGGVSASAVFLLAVAPTFPQVTNLLNRSEELTLSHVPSIRSMVEIWAPPVAAVVLVGAVALFAGSRAQLRLLPQDPLILIGLGFVSPPLVLFILAHVSNVVLWTPRYLFVIAPYGAMLFGALIASGLRNARSVRNATLAILLVGILVGTSVEHSQEYWRSAMSAADSITNPDTTVLLFSGLNELMSPEFLVDPEKRSYVTSPLAYYPVEGRVTPVPWATFGDGGEPLAPALAGVVTEELFVVITNEPRGSPLPFISGWVTAYGYEMTTARAFGSVRVAAFARR